MDKSSVDEIAISGSNLLQDKRFWLTVISTALILANKKLGLDLGPAEIGGIVAAVGAYITQSRSGENARIRAAGAVAAAKVQTRKDAVSVLTEGATPASTTTAKTPTGAATVKVPAVLLACVLCMGLARPAFAQEPASTPPDTEDTKPAPSDAPTNAPPPHVQWNPADPPGVDADAATLTTPEGTTLQVGEGCWLRADVCVGQAQRIRSTETQVALHEGKTPTWRYIALAAGGVLVGFAGGYGIAKAVH